MLVPVLNHSSGTVQQDFWSPVFFHHLNQPGPLTTGLKYFWIWLRIIQIFGVYYCTESVPAVWYCWESFDLCRPYLKGQSNEIFDLLFKFCGVYNCAESVSQQYDTALSQFPCSIILRGVKPFLTLLHRLLKGQCHKYKCGFLIYPKIATFCILQKSFRTKFFFDSPQCDRYGTAWYQYCGESVF